MITPRRWTAVVVGAVGVLVGIVVAINVIVDANGILRSDYSRQFQPPNLSVVKVNHLLRNKTRYDSYVFGSSREGGIHVGTIAPGRWYNMACAAGLPEEYLDHLKLFRKTGVTVRTVLIGLDDYSPLFDARQLLSYLDMQPHPAVSGKGLLAFYGENFLRLDGIVRQVSAYVRFNYTEAQSRQKRRLIYDIEGTGDVLCTDCDELVERNVEAHLHDPKFQQPWDYRFVEGDRVESAISAMKEIVALSKDAGFRLIVFINPIHQTTYLNTDLRKFARFKKELAEVTDYYDFSGLNSITTNNYYYFETSHFRPLVGDMMLDIMLGAPAVRHPRDFGFLVTRGNVDAHLRSQCLDVKRSSGWPNRGKESLKDAC